MNTSGNFSDNTTKAERRGEVSEDTIQAEVFFNLAELY